MSANLKKKVTVVGLLIVVCAVAFGFYIFTKGPVEVRNSSAQKIGAVALYEAYYTDTTTAQKNYAGKILQVSGVVTEVSTNLKGETIVLLKTNIEGAFINCTLEQKNNAIKNNDTLQVKGICSGIGQGEPDLGIKGDVYLTRSIIVE